MNQFHDSLKSWFLIGHKNNFVSNPQANIYRTAFMNLFDEEYLQTQLFSVSVWFMQESFLWDEVSVKMGPKIKKQRNSIMLAKQDEKCTNRGNYTVDWGKAVRKHQSTSRFVNAILQVYSNSFVWSTCVQPRPLGFPPPKKNNGRGGKRPPFAPLPVFFRKKPWRRGWLVLLKRKI